MESFASSILRQKSCASSRFMASPYMSKLSWAPLKPLYIPIELLDIILQYDGRIRYKNGKFVNIIHKKDERYDIIKPIINKKMKIMETIELCNYGFYFQFCFNTYKSIWLSYDFNFSNKDEFEVCYADWRNKGIMQIRTYL